MNAPVDLRGLPPGSRLVLRLPEGVYDLSAEDMARARETLFNAWQSGYPVILPPGSDLFVITPDGKVRGTNQTYAGQLDGDEAVTVEVTK